MPQLLDSHVYLIFFPKRWSQAREGLWGELFSTKGTQAHQVVRPQGKAVACTQTQICGTARPENCEEPSLKSTYRQRDREALRHHGEATWVWSKWFDVLLHIPPQNGGGVGVTQPILHLYQEVRLTST